jgi:hypothetical protein
VGRGDGEDAMRRRRHDPPKDTREIVIAGGHVLTCDQHRQAFSMPIMNAIDAMPSEWRELVNEYGPEAHDLFEQSVPIFSHQKRLSAAEAEVMLKRDRAQRQARATHRRAKRFDG